MAAVARGDDVIADLAFLRKGDGFTEARLERVPLIGELLRQSADDSFGRLRRRFVSAVHSLESDEMALLLDIFALSNTTEGSRLLQDRRRIHGATLQRSVDTIAHREAVALGHLATALIRGRYAQSPLLLDVPEMHNGIIYESTSTLLIVENRLWRRTIERYRFIATFDEADYLTVTRSYPARASVLRDSSFRLNSRTNGTGFDDHFWHQDKTRQRDEPMRRGESYDLGFTLEPDDFERQPAIVNASRAFHERSLLASIRVNFVGERPARLWRFEQLSVFAQPGRPHDGNRVGLDHAGTATLRLRDAHGGLFSGFGWEW